MSSSSDGRTEPSFSRDSNPDSNSNSNPDADQHPDRDRDRDRDRNRDRHTVLMSVRVSVSHSGIRPLCLPPPPGAGGGGGGRAAGEGGGGGGAEAGGSEESLCLQLSMDPGKSGEFRLSLRDSGSSSLTVAEFDLRTVNYEVKSPRCHELRMAAPPHDKMSFNFRCEQEAQEWATVVVSSLWEAHRVAETLISNAPQVPVETPAGSRSSLLTLQSTEDTCAELTRAIEEGDVWAASTLATALAQQNASLHIQPSVRTSCDEELSLAVVVEDCSSSCCVTVKVFPHATVASLKQQIFLEYGFHPRIQRWVIGQSLCSDHRSLSSYGVRHHGDTAFLYLLLSRRARLSPQLVHRDQESALLTAVPPPASPSLPPSVSAGNGPLPAQGYRPFSTLPPRLGAAGTAGGGTENRGKISEIRDLINLEMPQLSEALSTSRPAGPSTQGWSCPSCTYINKPTRPGCEICSTDRPDSYAVPGGYRPDSLELRRIQQEKEAVRQYQQEKGRREELRSAGAQNDSLLLNLDQEH